MSNFDFSKAQAYEMESSKQWLNENFHAIMQDIDATRAAGAIKPHYFDFFFQNDTNRWMLFAEHVKDKNCLEISSGPCGIFPLWGHWLRGTKTIIDPLIKEYEKYLCSKFGRSWFQTDVKMIDSGGEMFEESLHGQIDGFILWRNGIDHFIFPDVAIMNLSHYAKPGCYLLFWGDLQHYEAADDGHTNTPWKTAEEFESAIMFQGWQIIHRTPLLRDPSKVLDYGCVAIKL